MLEQIKTRIERRRAETQAVIDQFFSDHPDAAAKQHLIASVLPWVASSSDAASPRETLEEVRSIALSLPRGQGVSGIWHGTFSQVTTLPDGQKYSFNQFLRMALEQQGQSVKGIGEMGTGERLEVTGRVVDADFSGLVANTTSAINVKFTGSAADSQMVLSFSGAGLDQEVAGTATLFR